MCSSTQVAESADGPDPTCDLILLQSEARVMKT